jgi:hypothetical protein
MFSQKEQKQKYGDVYVKNINMFLGLGKESGEYWRRRRF